MKTRTVPSLSLIAALFLSQFSTAQSRYMVDSLTPLLDSNRFDTTQLAILNSLRGGYWGSDTQVTINERYGTLARVLMQDEHPEVRQYAEHAMARYLFTAGTQSLNRNDLRRAVELYSKGRRLVEQTGNSADDNQFIYGLSVVYGQVGDTAEMLRLNNLLLQHAIATNDSMAVMAYYPDTGSSPTALAALEQQLDKLERLGNRLQGGGVELESVWLSKAELLTAHGRTQEALLTLKRCTELASHNRWRPLLVPTYFGMLGSAYQELDSTSQALVAYRECQLSAVEERAWGTYCVCTDSLAALAMRAGNSITAIKLWSRSLEASRSAGLMANVLFTAGRLKEVYKQQGRLAELIDMMEVWSAAKDSVELMNAERDLMRMEFRDGQHLDSLTYEQERAEERRAADEQLHRERARRNLFLVAGIGLLVFGIVVFRQRGRIKSERDRSEGLLLNILPAEVAEELKSTGAAAAKHFDTATILFTDFKGFTQLSEQVSPAELVAELNTCFKAFDGIITARGIEKIKTIGDAYMCAGGLPDPKSSTPADVVYAALEMQAFMRKHKAEREAAGKPYFEMRVGIHSGPVVAGIVGVKKFQYDIWGDTVNTASRMESSGEVGQVNISDATYALVKEELGLTFTPRGKVQAKGKGEMEMYFVER